MKTKLAELNKAIEVLRGKRSQVAAAARLFLEGKLDRGELANWVAAEVEAERLSNEAARAYRLSY